MLARFYRIQWIFIPNLASEMMVPLDGAADRTHHRHQTVSQRWAC